jgi:hypothetical protein
VIDDENVRRALGRSLSTFQIGETGTGDHLFAAARASGVDADQLAALQLFIGEEQEHARLLGLVLDALEVARRDRHWTQWVFALLRRSRSMRAEVLTLLVAETIALTYYGALRDAFGSDELGELFARIHADEIRHVEFHAATLPPYLQRLTAFDQLIARVGWNVLVRGSSVAVALDHGRALRFLGMTRRHFLLSVQRDRRDLDHRLFAAYPTSEHRIGRPSRTDLQAARPITSGARPSAIETGDDPPPDTISTNAAHSAM